MAGEKKLPDMVWWESDVLHGLLHPEWFQSLFSGAWGLLASTFKFKVMVSKRAFLTIGDRAMGAEKSVIRPPSRHLAHSKFLGTRILGFENVRPQSTTFYSLS